MWLSLIAASLAYDADALLSRVEETRELRTLRITDPVPEIPEDAYRRAASGRVATGVFAVEGHRARMGYGVGVFNVPIDTLWRTLNSEPDHVDITPVSHIEVVDGAPCADHRKVLMILPVPMFTDRWWINENTYNTALADASEGQLRELTWRSLPDAERHPMSAEGRRAIDGLVEIEFSQGAWLLVALDDTHTLAEYHSWADPGGSVPVRAASLFATSGIADTFEAMAGYAASGSILCPPGT